MCYGFTGGANVLWGNPKWYGKLRSDAPPNKWANFGGDKVWPGPQDEWKVVMGRAWPPDEAFDGGVCTVDELPDGVRLIAPVSPYYGAWLVRELHLDAETSRLVINQKIEKLRLPIVNMLIWSVTQICSPDLVIIPLNPNSKFHKGFTVLHGGDVSARYRRRHGEFLLIRRHPKYPTKVGADSTAGWIASFHGDVVFTQHYTFEPDAKYPDGGCTVEVYTSPDPLAYVELELLSPVHRPNQGESFSFNISWQLHKLPHAPRSDAERIRIMRKLAGQFKRLK
ncbi:MAG TPA: DUF4380 domain-containing protein [Armatimonadetes bacterium]|nr:DUF4380 domain-containing protein [Armatimonadota bacterium]